MSSFSTPNIPKRRPIRKQNKFFSSAKISHRKNQAINQNFLNILRRIAYPQQPNPTNQMISFLNLRQRKEASMQCIPSIENMMSEQNIQDSYQGQSKSSIEHGFSDTLISENNCEMRVMYLCILEKILKKLQYNTSVSQRRKIIRGSWNIFVKYCKDMNYQIFANIGTSIEWGLLELLNFDFRITPKQKFFVEELLLEREEKVDHLEETSVQFL